MKLENQVVSLEIAKKLKELGLKQESLFHWEVFDGPINSPEIVTKTYPKTVQNNMDYFSAFTVAELGEMLPISIDGALLDTRKANGWYIRYKRDNDVIVPSGGKYAEAPFIGEWQETEADARGKMLIYLLENKLI